MIDPYTSTASLKDLKKEFKKLFLEHKSEDYKDCIACARQIRQRSQKVDILKLIRTILEDCKKDKDAGWDDEATNAIDIKKIEQYEEELTTLLCRDENSDLLDATLLAADQSAKAPTAQASKVVVKPAARESKESKEFKEKAQAPETKSHPELTVKVTSLQDCDSKLEGLKKSFSLEQAEAIRQFLTKQPHEKHKYLISAERASAHGYYAYHYNEFGPLARRYLDLYHTYLLNREFPLYFFDEVIAVFHQQRVTTCVNPEYTSIQILKHFLEKLNHFAKCKEHLAVKATWLHFLDFVFAMADSIVYGKAPTDHDIERSNNLTAIINFVVQYSEVNELPFSLDFFRSSFLYNDLRHHDKSDFEWISDFRKSLAYVLTIRGGEQITVYETDLKRFPKISLNVDTNSLISQEETKLGDDIAKKFAQLNLIGNRVCFAEYYDAVQEAIDDSTPALTNAILAFFYITLLSQKAGSPSLLSFFNDGGLAQAISGTKLAKKPAVTITVTYDDVIISIDQEELVGVVEKIKKVALLANASILSDSAHAPLQFSIPRQEIPTYFGVLLGYEYDVQLAKPIHKRVADELLMLSLDVVGIINEYVSGNFCDFDFSLISSSPDEGYSRTYAYLDHAEKYTEQEYYTVYKDILRYLDFLGADPTLWLVNIRVRLSELNQPFRIEQNILDNLNKLFKLGVRLFNPTHTFLYHLSATGKDNIDKSLKALVNVSNAFLQKVRIQKSGSSITTAGMWRPCVTMTSMAKAFQLAHEETQVVRCEWH